MKDGKIAKKAQNSSFRERVLAVVRSIPKGKTMTYGEVSVAAGVYGAARAVGTIMSQNSDKSVPCHRVIRADGKVGKYNGLRGADKLVILKREGVRFPAPSKKPKYKIQT